MSQYSVIAAFAVILDFVAKNIDQTEEIDLRTVVKLAQLQSEVLSAAEALHTGKG